ncbi:hypothetical protein E1264_07325 [Actinomadura sp. KC216]|uniref:hypothetical protein n=1 Tax=Actinomadura sp. KC216 TaxID=2530370 RepID=UPI00105307BD|nr:hypothetical protein [Actinomadura sp. KC216]TDB89690.1 hypothetical protein E1264_07325 [Actinomadura sp. KC216]
MESSGRGQARRSAGPETRPVTVWPEAPTLGAHPRLVLTPVPEARVPASAAVTDLAGAVVAGGVALLITAETGRRVGAPPPVTLVCAVASFAAVVGPRLGRFRATGPVRDGWGPMGWCP